jgi:hypothetical protein
MKRKITLFILRIFGILPCILTAPYWGFGLLSPLGMFADFHSLNGFIEGLAWSLGVFMLALSGLFGLKFFSDIIAKYKVKSPWSKKDYIYGLYAFTGCSIVFFYTLKDEIASSLFSAPMVSAIIAYFTRFKDNHEK